MSFDGDSELFATATEEREADDIQPAPLQVRQRLTALADAYGLPSEFVRAVAQTESGLDTEKTQTKPGTRSDAFAPDNKAYGVMQVRDDQIGRTVRGPDGSSFQIGDDIKSDWKANAQAGVALLAQHYQLAGLESPFGSEQERAQQAYSGYSGGAPFRDRYLQTLPYSDLPAHPDDRAFLQNFRQARAYRGQQDPSAAESWSDLPSRESEGHVPAQTLESRPDADRFSNGNDNGRADEIAQSSEQPATPQQVQSQGSRAQTNADVQGKIVAAAQKYSDAGSAAWALDTKKDEFPAGSNKCNKFVGDVLTEAGTKPVVLAKDGKPIPIAPGSNTPRPPTAAEWADAGVTIQNWRVVGPNEKPQPGDVAAYKIEQGQFAGATGHSGVVTSVDPNGHVNGTAAHFDKVGPDDKFQPSTPDSARKVVYRRYTGP